MRINVTKNKDKKQTTNHGGKTSCGLVVLGNVLRVHSREEERM